MWVGGHPEGVKTKDIDLDEIDLETCEKGLNSWYQKIPTAMKPEPFVSGCSFQSFLFMVASRDFHLVHRDFVIPVESWVAVEPNGTGLPYPG